MASGETAPGWHNGVPFAARWAYFTGKYRTEWGEPINFDGENAGPVREFFLANASRAFRKSMLS